MSPTHRQHAQHASGIAPLSCNANLNLKLHRVASFGGLTVEVLSQIVVVQERFLGREPVLSLTSLFFQQLQLMCLEEKLW